MLYADLWEEERSWAHMVALYSVISAFGCPSRYYVDSHSIFRYVPRRDGGKYSYTATEEEANVQWKAVLKDLNVEPIYALSPQAKGKIERPYRWIQDRLVRTCAREGIKDIAQARKILTEEIHQYNTKRVHGTTKEIPIIRLERALQEKKTLFRSFEVRSPFKSKRDIFCFRINRTVNAMHRVKFNNLEFGTPNLPIGQTVELRISPDQQNNLLIVRFWHKGQYLNQESKVKVDDVLKSVFKF